MKSIILVGYMCAGKTTVGKSLAKNMGIDFYDLDWYIEDRFHKRIPDIFAEKGEAGFRDIERRMLHEAAEFENIVLSCGGGTPCFFDNMEYMNQAGITFYLKASINTLITHYRLSHTIRPLLKDKSDNELEVFMRSQLRERSSYYEQAQHIIDVNVLDNYDKIDIIVSQIRKILNRENGKMEN